MAFLEKTLNIIVWFLIISSMIWFVYGCYDLINLFFMEG
jgi:TRAP-type C4-dicarboxylate transport system permease small subunit